MIPNFRAHNTEDQQNNAPDEPVITHKIWDKGTVLPEGATISVSLL